MKTQNGFTLLEKVSEIGTYLKKQSVSRKVTRLQVHHTALPRYSTWYKTDKKVYSEPHFGRTESLDSYGKTTWNSKSANGKYIAQHFTVFPDGQITTGRSLNSNPIGITGWNDSAICVEIYGDFDKGKDTMNSTQKKAVISLFGELCKRFNITPSDSTIRYHAWFTSGGSYLGNYVSGKSRKTCPGTGFFGGNTMRAFKSNFLPEVKAYINGTSTVTETKVDKVGTVKCDDALNVRKESNANTTKLGTLSNGKQVKIVAECNNGWLKIKYDNGYGYVNGNYISNITEKFKPYYVKVVCDTLNGRAGAGTNYNVVQKIKKDEVVTVLEEKALSNGDKWGKTKYYWINIGSKYVKFVRYV